MVSDIFLGACEQNCIFYEQHPVTMTTLSTVIHILSDSFDAVIFPTASHVHLMVLPTASKHMHTLAVQMS